MADNPPTLLVNCSCRYPSDSLGAWIGILPGEGKWLRPASGRCSRCRLPAGKGGERVCSADSDFRDRFSPKPPQAASPNGLDATRQMLKNDPAQRIFVVTDVEIACGAVNAERSLRHLSARHDQLQATSA